jgi:chemotaxis response regulator CheB
MSGVELDGEKGVNAIKKNDGLSAVLNASNCLCKEMGENILRKCIVDKIVDLTDATEFITELHKGTGDEPLTA